MVEFVAIDKTKVEELWELSGDLMDQMVNKSSPGETFSNRDCIMIISMMITRLIDFMVSQGAEKTPYTVGKYMGDIVSITHNLLHGIGWKASEIKGGIN